MKFVNQYYKDNLNYEAMSVLVVDPKGEIEENYGSIVSIDDSKLKVGKPGMIDTKNNEVCSADDNNKDSKFLYYAALTADSQKVCVLLPFKKGVTENISPTTTDSGSCSSPSAWLPQSWHTCRLTS